MSDTLFGGVESGTPLETRAGANEAAAFFQRLIGGDTSGFNNFQRLGAQSFANLFGITPGEVGIEDIIRDLLMDPESQTEGVFAAMRPFERRATNEAVSGTRALFGTAGGRFSRNVADAESRVRGELSDTFARTREQALLQAQGQRGGFLATLFQLANQNQQASLAPLALAASFLQPGAPIYKEGLLPGLLSAAGSIYAAKQFNRPPGGGVPPTPGAAPTPSNPFGPGGPYYRP